MAEEEEEENKVPKVDPIVFLRDWFKTRVLSSLKCKEDLVNKLVDIEPSAAAVDSFWKESETQRLIVYFKDADLIVVRSNPTSHPPPQHRIIGDLPRPIAHFFIAPIRKRHKLFWTVLEDESCQSLIRHSLTVPPRPPRPRTDDEPAG